MSLDAIAPLRTAHLLIRPVQAADLDDLLAVNGDPEVVNFLPYAVWADVADGRAWLQRMQALEATGTGRQFVIAQGGRVIGTVLLFRHDVASARAELGYVLGRAHWRQGLAREALHAVCAAGFASAGLRRIEAEVHPDNLASTALLRSLGFTLEGRLRQRWCAKGVTYDTDIHGLLRGELTPPR